MLARAAPRTPSQRERALCDPCGHRPRLATPVLVSSRNIRAAPDSAGSKLRYWDPKVRHPTPLVRNATGPLATAATARAVTAQWPSPKMPISAARVARIRDYEPAAIRAVSAAPEPSPRQVAVDDLRERRDRMLRAGLGSGLDQRVGRCRLGRERECWRGRPGRRHIGRWKPGFVVGEVRRQEHAVARLPGGRCSSATG